MISLSVSVRSITPGEHVLDFVRENDSESDLLPPLDERVKRGSVWYGANLDGELVGVAQLHINDDVEVGPLCIHKDYRRRGIGSSLLDEITRATQKAGRSEIVMRDVDRRCGNCTAFLETKGFHMKDDGVKMEWKGCEIPDVDIPDDYQIRTYREGDEEEWADCINRAFSTVREPKHYTARRIRNEWVNTPNFMPGGTFFAIHKGKMVGTFMAWRQVDEGPKRGRLHWLGVVPEHRRRGLAKALTVKVLNYLLSQDLTSIFLVTGYSLEVAMEMYRGFGFVEAPRLFDYVKKLG